MISLRITLTGAILLVSMQSAVAEGSDAAFLSCIGISGASARLACYDAAAAGRQPSRPDNQPDFLPGKPLHPKSSAAEEAAITVEVTSFGMTDDRPTFHLANGQVWEDQDQDSLFPDPDHNTVTISRSGLGLGYRLRMNQETREMTVKRIK